MSQEKFFKKYDEKTLCKSAQIMEKLQSIANVGIWELDLNTSTLICSDEVYHIFGLKTQEFTLRYNSFLDLIHPDDRSMVDQFYSRSLKQGKDEFEIEPRIVRKDNGEIRYVLLRCDHERDQTGGVICSVGIVQDITNRKSIEHDLQQALGTARSTENELQTLLEASRTILTIEDFPTAARLIFDNLSGLIGSTAGYVALLSEKGEENELLFLESGGRPCAVNPELPMPIRGLRAESYKSNTVVKNNDFMHSHWMQDMPKGHVDLDNVMFAPLVVEDKTLGIIGLANKPGGFTSHDAKLAKAFGDLAAISLRNARLLEKLNKLSRTNHLTGCFNRRGFTDRLDYEIKRVERTNTDLALIMFDIDYFKQVNDTFGHDVGDQVLQEIAEITSKNLRKVDTLARWGGEEFLILVPDTDGDSTWKLAERLRKIVDNHDFPKVGKITASFGIVQYRRGDSRDKLISRADQCMYLAKQNGRNRVEIEN
ncbi:MAG: diguanylate cyclase [Desulfovermiculus sp.]